jgi:hypothetical protein
MAPSTETRLLKRNGFLAGEAFEDDFEANDFLVTDLDGAAFADGQDDSFADFQSVQLSVDGLSKRLCVHEAFDRHQTTAKGGRRLKALHFGDSQSYLTITDGNSLSCQSHEIADTFLRCSDANPTTRHQLQHPIANLTPGDRMHRNAILGMHGR